MTDDITNYAMTPRHKGGTAAAMAEVNPELAAA